jgi:hypothetical protein
MKDGARPRFSIVAFAAVLSVVSARGLLAQEEVPPASGGETGLPAGFDPIRGLWFPPGVSPETYVAGDSSHSFSSDVRAAFEKSAELRREVCALLVNSRFEVDGRRLEPRVAQMRTLEHMLCAGMEMKEKQLEHAARRKAGASGLLEGWYAEERASAEELSPQERRKAEYELRHSVESIPAGNDRARAAVRMIALRPQDDLGLWCLLTYGEGAIYGEPEPGDIEGVAALPGETPHLRVNKKDIRELAERIYRAGIEAGGTSAGPYRGGFAAYLYLTGGDLAEARRLAAAWAADPANDNAPYERIVVALFDRLLEKPEPLSALLSSCPYPGLDPVAASLSRDYCRAVAWSVANRAVLTRGSGAPKVLADVFIDVIRSEPTNWPLRMESIRSIDVFAPERAVAEFQAVLDLPATAIPIGARLDALDGITGALIDRKDFRRALSVNQHWLDTAEYRPLALAPDGWARLAAGKIPTSQEVRSSDVVVNVLAKRLWLAIGAGDIRLARRTLEEHLALDLSIGEPVQSRRLLRLVAEAETQAGHGDAALRIIRYLWGQAFDPISAQLLRQDRDALSPPGGPPPEMTRVERPWDPMPSTSTSP